MSIKPSYIDFDHNKFKLQLKTYTTKSEVGVLSYKYSKILAKYWRFKTPDTALLSAKILYKIFKSHIASLELFKDKINNDIHSKKISKYFIKADLCRKFIQMGYTRAKRYYYHKSGIKWKKTKTGKWNILPNEYDDIKLESANIFKIYLKKIMDNKLYTKSKIYFNKLPKIYKQIDI
jgi:adenylosuccinate lyase